MDADDENTRISLGGSGQIHLDSLPTLKACLCAYRRTMGRWQLALATIVLYFVFQLLIVYSVWDLGPGLVRAQLIFTAQQYRREAQSWTSDQVSKSLPLLSYLIAVVTADLIKFCNTTDLSSVMLDLRRLDFLLWLTQVSQYVNHTSVPTLFSPGSTPFPSAASLRTRCSISCQGIIRDLPREARTTRTSF